MRRAILVVAPYLPWPVDFGGAARIWNLVRGLAREHEVMLLAPATSEEREAVSALGAICDVTAVPVEWTTRQPAGVRKRLLQLRALAGGSSFLEAAAHHAHLQPAIDRLFLTRSIDVVQFEFSHLGIYSTPRPCATVVDIHNVEYRLLQRIAATSSSNTRRLFNVVEGARVRALEHRTWRRATHCVVTSREDASLVQAVTGRQASLVPNGVDTSWFQPSPEPSATPSIVFTGAMRHAPNADGARWYLDRVHPLVVRAVPSASVAIVGADPPADLVARNAPGITITGRVEDVRPWLSNARVAIVPLLSGGGTRLKILEAFAGGIPVVSTSVGAEGLDVEDGSSILLADSPAAFARAVVKLLSDDDLAGRIAANGLALARERYDWSHVVPALVAAHDAAIARFAAAENAKG